MLFVCFKMETKTVHWHFSEPSHQNDPVEGFQPIQNDAVHFLDITNEGLIPGLSPNKKANDLWASIDQQIQDDWIHSDEKNEFDVNISYLKL